MSTVRTVALRGLTGYLLTVTASAVLDQPPELILTGGPGRDERELRDRVRAALRNSGQLNRPCRVEVHLDETAFAPSAAAVATAMLAATTATPAQRLADTAVLGEVGLDGSLRPTHGTLPAVHAARTHGISRVIVPAAALREAALVDDITVLGAHSLSQVADWLHGNNNALSRPGNPETPVADDEPPPARRLAAPVLRAVEIAAAGGHHLLLDALDGAQAHLAARWLHHLLPDLTPAQQLEIAAIQSLTGPREDGALLVNTPPLVTAHASDTPVSLAGGTLPGVVSQAHHGVLVTGDLDQFTGAAHDTLRFVLRHRDILLAQGGHPLRFPADLQLVASHTPGIRRPQLPPALLDAIDIRIRLDPGTTRAAPPLYPGMDRTLTVGQVLAQARTLVGDARARATVRWNTAAAHSASRGTNADVSTDVLHSLPLPDFALAVVRRAQDTGALSGRGVDCVLRLAWTAADLDGVDLPTQHHVEEALALRQAATTRPDERQVR